jgi:hypothetical protein
VAAEECKHELPPDQCGLCRPRARTHRSAAPPGAVDAQYPGECTAECGHRIRPGDPIIPDPAGDGWMHRECW